MESKVIILFKTSPQSFYLTSGGCAGKYFFDILIF